MGLYPRIVSGSTFGADGAGKVCMAYIRRVLMEWNLQGV